MNEAQQPASSTIHNMAIQNLNQLGPIWPAYLSKFCYILRKGKVKNDNQF